MPDEKVADGQDTTQDAIGPETEVGAVTDPVTDVDGDGGTDDTPATADDTPPSLDAILERDELLRQQYEERLRERENAGANRREAQLKREAGRKDVTTRNVQRFLSELGIEVEDPSRLHYFQDLALAHEAIELATNVPEALLRNHPVPVEAREQAVAAREAGDWDGYVGTLLNGAVQAEIKKLRAEDEKRIVTEVNRRVSAEIKARGIEKAPVRDTPPTAPGGGAPAPIPYSRMTTEQRAAMTPAERDAAVAASIGV